MLRDFLRRPRASPVIIEAGCVSSAASLLDGADHLAGELARRGSRRVLVRSSSATEIARCLLATEAVGAALFIAHGWLSDGLLEGLVREQHVTAVLDQAPGQLVFHPGATVGPGAAPRVYVMTSGTTGPPKIAEHTMTSLLGHIRPGSTAAAGRWLLTYPPSTYAGLQVLLTVLANDATLVVPEDRAIGSCLAAAERHEVTHMSGTPTFWRALLLAMGRASSLPSVKQATLGGERADQSTLDRLAARFPEARISHIYASTEAGALFSVQDKREGFPSAWLDAGIGGVALRVRNGVLEARSERQASAYVSRHPMAVAEDGWLSTGDMVRVEKDRVVFEGREDGSINIGGFKVTPETVESVLLGVEGVCEARVFGVPSRLTGQTLVAEIVCSPGLDPEAVRLRALRQAREGLESFKVPRVIRVVGTVAASDSGKKARGA